MNKEQQMVYEFHKAFEIDIADRPTVPTEKVANLRIELIKEEFEELICALRQLPHLRSLTEISDALGDLLYVVYGAGVSLGIDLEEIFTEIHRSNMTKVGGYKRDDGKWIKPDTYEACQLAPIIQAQIIRGVNYESIKIDESKHS